MTLMHFFVIGLLHKHDTLTHFGLLNTIDSLNDIGLLNNNDTLPCYGLIIFYDIFYLFAK